MTRRGTLAYYLAAWVVGCFVVSLLIWVLAPREAPLAGPFDVSGSLVIIRLKERKDPDMAELDKKMLELQREAELAKAERVVGDWTQARCLEAKKAKQIVVNTDVLRYEDATETPAYEPCTSHRMFGG